MDHEQRVRLAQELCARTATAFPGDLLLAGLYGSTARGTDTPWSDLELLFVVRDGGRPRSRELLCQGIAVTVTALPRRKLERTLTHPCRQWPFWMGILSVLEVLHGDPAQPAAWLQMGQAVPPHAFRQALERELPGLVVESYGRILSCQARGNRDDIACAVLEVLFEMRDALCLLNRRWVTHDYFQGLLETFGFPRLPAGYRELVPALWQAREIDEIAPLAERLYVGYRRLLAEEGLRWPDYPDVSQVPL